MQVKKQQLELDMEQWTGSKLKKECVKAIFSPCLFNLYGEYIMQNAGLDEAHAGIENMELIRCPEASRSHFTLTFDARPFISPILHSPPSTSKVKVGGGGGAVLSVLI